MYHPYAEVDEMSIAGMVLGFTVIGIGCIMGVALIIYDQTLIHKDYDKKLADAINQINGMGLDLTEIDKKFWAFIKRQKTVKIGAEDE